MFLSTSVYCLDDFNITHRIGPNVSSCTLQDMPVHGMCQLKARTIVNISEENICIYSDFTTTMHFRTCEY